MTKKKKPVRRRAATKLAKAVDPYKVWVVATTLAPAFATAYFTDALNISNAWTNYDDMADELVTMATAIAKRLR